MASIFDSDPDEPPAEARERETPSRSKERKGLTPAQFSQGRRTLYEKVQRAFETLESAMASADFPTAVKAAQIILDRTGYGPKSTVDVNTTAVDLTALSSAELADRARRIAHMLSEKRVTPVTKETIQ